MTHLLFSLNRQATCGWKLLLLTNLSLTNLSSTNLPSTKLDWYIFLYCCMFARLLWFYLLLSYCLETVYEILPTFYDSLSIFYGKLPYLFVKENFPLQEFSLDKFKEPGRMLCGLLCWMPFGRMWELLNLGFILSLLC